MTEPTEPAAWTDDPEDWGPPPQPAPARRNVRIVIEGASDDVLLQALGSLLIGSAAEGSDQFLRRLKEWQAKTSQLGDEIYSESPNETEGERVRYAVIGLLAQVPGAASNLLTRALDAGEAVYRRMDDELRPVTRSRALRPARRRYNALSARGAAMTERWIDEGRRQEQRGRALAHTAAVSGTDESFDKVFDRLAEDPGVRDLITQQSFGMAEQLMGEARVRSAEADVRWEQRIRKFLRRA